MSDWSDGYVTDIGYTLGYYPDLNPLQAKLAFASVGLVCPEIETACELGFGQGLSVNLHAAASTMSWFGADFNPAQAGFAQHLAAVAGAGARLFDQSFAEFRDRADLPEFDYIGLHGIWSWISDDNRSIIVDFVRRKLKAGGILYVSYNVFPGWSAFAPMRHIMSEHAEVMGADGRGVVGRVEDAVAFAEKLLATNPMFARVNPHIVARVEALKRQNRHYLAHEYFNRDWRPMHFATMAKALKAAKLDYAGSANLLDHVEVVNLTAEQQAFLKEIPDPTFREGVRDFMVNQQFRKDYWVKGARSLSLLERAGRLRSQRIVLTRHRPDVAMKVKGAQGGEATLTDSIYGPILDLLADHKPTSIGAIEARLKDRGLVLNQIVQAVLLLAGVGAIAPAQEEAVVAKAKHRTARLNAYIIAKARGDGDIAYLASPVTGGGAAATRFEQLFLEAASQSKKQPAEWAGHALQVLQMQGQKIVKDGKTLETPAENHDELVRQATAFQKASLPIFKELQIV